MPLMILVMILIPISTIAMAPLSIFWILQRSRLLQISPESYSYEIQGKIAYIEKKRVYLWIPLIIFFGWIATIAITIVLLGKELS